MAGSGRRVTVPRYCLGKEVNAARVCHNGDQGGRGRQAGGPKRNENCQITSVEWNLAYCEGNSNVTLTSVVTIQIH